MTPAALDGAPAISACLLELAGRVFAVEITQAREVRVFEHYTVVPLAPAELIGMTNLRGAIVPIVDLRARLGLPPHPRGGAIQTLVVEARDVRVALAIDGVLGVEALEEAGGGLRRGDERVPILDVAGIVDGLAGRTVETPA